MENALFGTTGKNKGPDDYLILCFGGQGSAISIITVLAVVYLS